jgi:hypothetical protein
MNQIQNNVTCEKIESQFYEKVCSIVAQVFYPNHTHTKGYADAQERSLSSCPLKP